MTRIEAWKAWCKTAGTESLADEFTLEKSSHGKAFSFAWDAAHEACALVADEVGNRDNDSHAWDAAAAIRAKGDNNAP